MSFGKKILKTNDGPSLNKFPLPVWAIPVYVLTHEFGQSDSGRLIERSGLTILNGGKTITVRFKLFDATCYQVSPPNNKWLRTPDIDGASCEIIDPMGNIILRVTYRILGELTGTFAYGVSTP